MMLGQSVVSGLPVRTTDDDSAMPKKRLLTVSGEGVSRGGHHDEPGCGLPIRSICQLQSQA